MKRKLQVFVSSTYEDLKEERQAAVQAILNSGHIPAGMELFSAGDESQKDTIKRWIDESDVYLLILGGRYGSIDQNTELSYTHWEYEYAGNIGKPRFAVVISEDALEIKVKKMGTSVMEKENGQKYKDFRKEVLSKICKIFQDERDIQLAIFHKMGEYSSRTDLTGWIHGSDVPNVNSLINENSVLRAEIETLKEQLKRSTTDKVSKKVSFDGLTYEELYRTLRNIKINIPKGYFKGTGGIEIDLLSVFVSFKDSYATGITNQFGMSDDLQFMYFNIAPKLMTFGLLEKVKSGAKLEKIQTSKQGFEFLKLFELALLKSKSEKEVKPAVDKKKPDINKKNVSAPKNKASSRISRKNKEVTAK